MSTYSEITADTAKAKPEHFAISLVEELLVNTDVVAVAVVDANPIELVAEGARLCFNRRHNPYISTQGEERGEKIFMFLHRHIKGHIRRLDGLWHFSIKLFHSILAVEN